MTDLQINIALAIGYTIVGFCVALLIHNTSLKSATRRGGQPEIGDRIVATFLGGVVGMIWPCAAPLLFIVIVLVAVTERKAKR